MVRTPHVRPYIMDLIITFRRTYDYAVLWLRDQQYTTHKDSQGHTLTNLLPRPQAHTKSTSTLDPSDTRQQRR